MGDRPVTNIIVNNKDGNTQDRGASFSGYCPNTYNVVSATGEWIAQIVQIRDPQYNFRTTAWTVRGRTFQYFRDAKAFAKTME
jgi:hypothetical protein